MSRCCSAKLFCLVLVAAGSMMDHQASDATLRRAMDFLHKYNRGSAKISVNVDSLRCLSRESRLFLKAVLRRFPAVVFERSAIALANDRDMAASKNLTLREWSERRHLSILLMEVSSEEELQDRLVDNIRFLLDVVGKLMRPKCLIVFTLDHFSNTSTNLRSFFNYAWSNEFLYVTVFEIQRRQSLTYNRFIQGISAIDMEVVSHHFNPFTDQYRCFGSASLDQAPIDFESQKLSQLNGYPLRAGVILWYPDAVMDVCVNASDDPKDVLIGRYYSLTKAIAKALNFSFSIDLVIFGNDDFRDAWPFNDSTITWMQDDDALYENVIDFVINLYALTGFKSLQEYSFEYSGFSLPRSHFIAVKQYSRPLRISANFFYACAALTIPLVAVILLAKILGDKGRFWSLLNMIKLLFGVGVPIPRSFKRKMIFLIFSLLSIVLTTKFYQIVLTLLTRRTYLKLQTLQELLDSKITPTINEELKDLYGSSKDYEALNRLFDESKTSQNYGNDYKCVLDMMLNNRGPSGCDIDDEVVRFFKDTYSSREEWKISVIEEPFATGRDHMLFSKASPYVDGFDLALRRIFESGITAKMMSEIMQTFPAHTLNIGDECSTRSWKYQLGVSADERQFDGDLEEGDGKGDQDRSLSSTSCAIVLIAGHALASFVFLLEMFSTQLKRILHRIITKLVKNSFKLKLW
ncbi:hypothetical protein TKK_0016760 [Trichogramma kaykai]